MLFDDSARVEHYLAHIGYYRLSAYWLPFEQPSERDNSSRNHYFRAGTHFEQVLALYIFDRKLRLLVMEALERIEVVVRTRWAGAMALRHGAHAHMNPALFHCPWQHVRDLARVVKDLDESSETFVLHYRKRYKDPFLPPIWAIVETMSFGTLSRWVKGTRDNEAKKEVAVALGMPTIDILEKVLHALTPVRNVCAHHGRLWNRRFAMSLPHIKRISERMVSHDAPNHQDHHLFNCLVVIDLMMKTINPSSSWTRRLADLLVTVGDDDLQAMGFPSDWKHRAPWKELVK